MLVCGDVQLKCLIAIVFSIGLLGNDLLDHNAMSEQEEAALERARAADQRRQEFEQLEQQREFERAMIEERDQGIREIESAVVTVNEIFTDLASLVEEQGEMIGNCLMKYTNVFY